MKDFEIPGHPVDHNKLPLKGDERIAQRLSPRFRNRHSVLGIRIAIFGALVMALGGIEMWRHDLIALRALFMIVGTAAMLFCVVSYLTSDVTYRRLGRVRIVYLTALCLGYLVALLGCCYYPDATEADRDALRKLHYLTWGVVVIVGLVTLSCGMEIWHRAPINNSVENEIAGAGFNGDRRGLPLWMLRTLDRLYDAMFGGWLGAIAWNMITDALVKSKNALEREHIFLGKFADERIPIVRWVPCSRFGFPIITTEQFKQIPVLLHIALLYLGCLITGAIGSGKTMMAMLGIVLQLVKRRAYRIFIIDMKGDEKFFKATMGPMFYKKFFSSNRHATTWVWNPFADSVFRAMSPAEKAQVISHGLGAYFGDKYGANFFLGQIELIIQAAFELRPNIGSLRELFFMLRAKKFYKFAKVSPRELENAGQLIAALRQLAAIEQINVTSGKPFEYRIDIGEDLLETGETYFSLPVSINPMAAKFLSRVVSLLISAGARKRGEDGPRVFLCVDECQEWVNLSMIPILRMSRDSRLHLILALQNTSDLKTPGGDFLDVVSGNTGVKITCTALDLSARERLKIVGGETIRELRSTSTGTNATGGESHSEQTREVVVPEFDPNKINALNNTTGHACFEASPHSGYTRLVSPRIISMPYPLDPFAFERLCALPMPEPNGISTIRGVDVKQEPEENDDTQGVPVPVPPPTPPVPNGAEKKPKRKRGKLTPEEEDLMRADEEMLRKLAGR